MASSIPGAKMMDTISQDQQHGFDGNPDIYGIGIRVGYYTQAISTWVAMCYVPHEARFLQSINILFMMAMLVAIGLLSHNPADTFALEPFMLAQITYYMALLGTSDFFVFSAAQRLVGEASFLALDAYGAWFWWYGLDRMKPTPGGETLVWFYLRGDIYTWPRTAFRILCIPMLSCRFLRLCTIIHHAAVEYRYRCATPPSFLRSLEAELSGYLHNQRTPCGVQDVVELGRQTSKRSVNEYVMEILPATVSVNPNSSGRRSPHRHADQDTLQTVPDPEPGSMPANATDSGRNRAQLQATSSLCILPDIGSPVSDTDRKIIISEDTQNDPECANPSSNASWPPPIEELYTANMHLSTIFSSRAYKRIHAAIRFLFMEPLNPIFLTPLLNQSPSIPSRNLLLLIHLNGLQEPLAPRSRRVTQFVAGATFMIVSILIIVVELTLNWNSVRGVQRLNTVGQLVPCVLGVGGLVKVASQVALGHTHRRECSCIVGQAEMERKKMWVESAGLWRSVRQEIEKRKGRGRRQAYEV